MIGNYKLVKASQLEDFSKPYVWQFPLETDKSIVTSDIDILRSHSFYLFKNLGPLRVAIQEKAMYAVGHNHWLPIFRGTDLNYKGQVQEWLIENWYPICNVLGEEFDFQSTLFLISIHLDVWGESFIYLTESEEGYPMIQIVSPYSVVQPRQAGALKDGFLTGSSFDGKFKGMKVEMGVVKNPQGRAIGYHVKADRQDDDQIVDAIAMIRVRELDLGDETRATPTLSHGINQGRSILSLMENEQNFLEMASRINILEWNELGGIDPTDPGQLLSVINGQPGSAALSSDAGATQTNLPPINGNRQTVLEWQQKSQTKYFTANTGAKIQAFQFNRPAQEWQQFMDKLSRFLIDPVWPYYLVDREADLGGAQCRGLLARANRIVQDRQQLLRRVARRAVGYAVAKGAKIGRIPGSPQWWQWDFTTPARITVDFGRDSKAELLEIEGEILDPAETIEARGLDVDTFYENFYTTIARKQLAKAKIEKQYGITIVDTPDPVIAGADVPGSSGQ
jgi:hypothetical protein